MIYKTYQAKLLYSELRKGPSWSWAYGSWIYNYKCTYAIGVCHH